MKLQWGVVMLGEHGIVGVGRWRRLTTATREYGGAVMVRSGEEIEEAKYGRANG
jgi:hypothetical protein